MTSNALQAIKRPAMETGQTLYTLIASIAAGIAVLVPVVPRIYSTLRRDNKRDRTEEAGLRVIERAVEIAVKRANESEAAAWRQAAKERELRELAEARTSTTMSEVENLRGEVAKLRRQIEHLTSVIQHYQSVPGATPHS